MAIFNVIGGANQCLHIGLSSDSKPASPNGFVFLEVDTSKLFLRASGAWVEQINSSYEVAGGGGGGGNTDGGNAASVGSALTAIDGGAA